MAVFFEGCARQSYATTLNQGDLGEKWGVGKILWRDGCRMAVFFEEPGLRPGEIFGFMDVRAHAGGNNFCI